MAFSLRPRSLAFLAVIALLVVPALPAPALAASPTDALYGVNSADQGISIIDPATATADFLFTLGDAGDGSRYITPAAMAVSKNGTIYVWNNNACEDDRTPLTGDVLDVDPIGRTVVLINRSLENQLDVQALAFSNGWLFGFGVGADRGIYLIDPQTGLANTWEYYHTDQDFYAADTAADGVIYAVSQGSGGQALYRFDVSTWNVTEVAPLSMDVGTIGAIVFEPDGTLLGSASGGAVGNALFDIDPLTGEVGNVRPMRNGAAAPEGMGFAPGPPTNHAPVIGAVTIADELWAPNHKWVNVTLDVAATDPDGPSDIVRTTYAVADEYGECNVAETDLPPDGVVPLVAARDGDDADGRVYTVTVTVYDAGGLSDSATVDVIVSHDQGK